MKSPYLLARTQCHCITLATLAPKNTREKKAKRDSLILQRWMVVQLTACDKDTELVWYKWLTSCSFRPTEQNSKRLAITRQGGRSRGSSARASLCAGRGCSRCRGKLSTINRSINILPHLREPLIRYKKARGPFVINEVRLAANYCFLLLR